MGPKPRGFRPKGPNQSQTTGGDKHPPPRFRGCVNHTPARERAREITEYRAFGPNVGFKQSHSEVQRQLRHSTASSSSFHKVRGPEPTPDPQGKRTAEDGPYARAHRRPPLNGQTWEITGKGQIRAEVTAKFQRPVPKGFINERAKPGTNRSKPESPGPGWPAGSKSSNCPRPTNPTPLEDPWSPPA